jgi:chromosome partitioning protein
MKTIAVSVHKGGVGKSTTVQTLGWILATEYGLRVVLFDLDPQASLTEACGVLDVAGQSLAEILRPLADRLWLAPADQAMAPGELGLMARLGREAVLYKAIASLGDAYDVALVDTPTSLGLLTINALRAAHGVLIPILPQAADLRTLVLFRQTLDSIRREINPTLQELGIVPTMFDRRLIHHRQALAVLYNAGLPLFLKVNSPPPPGEPAKLEDIVLTIPDSIRVAEASAAHQSITVFEPENPAALAYRELGKIVTQWLNDPHTQI